MTFDNQYAWCMIWLGLGRLTLSIVKVRSVFATYTVLIAWPFVLTAVGLLAFAREWRRLRDFPRPVIVRYRATTREWRQARDLKLASALAESERIARAIPTSARAITARDRIAQ